MKKVDHVLACSVKKKKKQNYIKEAKMGGGLKKAVKDLEKFSFLKSEPHKLLLKSEKYIWKMFNGYRVDFTKQKNSTDL